MKSRSRPSPPRSPPHSSRPSAHAKFFQLQQADVVARVEPDGALRVRERILFGFVGSFTGAYRDIPLRPGESIDGVFVSEGPERYRPGASAELGSFGRAGHLRDGADRRPFPHRLALLGERRGSHVHDRLSAVRADGRLRRRRRCQPQGLGRRVGAAPGQSDGQDGAAGSARGPAYRVWGHPAWVRGEVRKTPRAALLAAFDVPPKQFVELRSVFPRSLLQSTAGARVVDGPACRRSSPRSARTRAAYERDRDRIDDALDNIVLYVLLLLLLAIGPALVSQATCTSSSAASARPATTATTSKSRRPTSHPRSSRRSSRRAPASGR